MAAKKSADSVSTQARLLSLISLLTSKVESGEIESMRDFKSAVHVEFLKNSF